MDSCESMSVVPADHPALPGHFPGQPVVPGVVILDQVLQAVARWLPGAGCAQQVDAKFVAPLLPEEPLRICLTRKAEQRVDFICRAGGQTVAQGRLTLQRNGA